MPYYVLEPDIPGDFGENMELNTNVQPQRATRVHLELDNWFGDDLIESNPIYAVSTKLANALVESGYRAFELRDMELTVAPEGQELIDEQGLENPEFRWLEITGIAGTDDIGLSGRGWMVVSEEALNVIRGFRVDAMDVSEYDPAEHG